MRNKFEEKIASQIKKAGFPLKYETKKLNYTITGLYIVDFILPGPIYIETKGYLRPEDRRKMAGVRKANPEADIRFCFQCSGTTKQGKSYAKWATKNGFQYSFGELPKEWLQTT